MFKTLAFTSNYKKSIKVFCLFIINCCLSSLALAQFTDASLNPNNITVFGNANLVQGQSKFGGVAGVFDGDGDYLQVLPSPIAADAKAITIEAWIYIENVGPNGWPIVSQTYGTILGDQQFYVSGSNGGSTNENKLRFTRGADLAPAVDLIGTSVLPLNQWIHVAYSSDGVTANLFVNGAKEASVSLATAWVVTGQPFLVATNQNIIASQNVSYAKGRISDLRVTNNTARYNEIYNPTSPQILDGSQVDKNWVDTVLLLTASGDNESKNFKDYSLSSKLISVFNGAKISTAQSKYGGSAIFLNGSGDKLTVSGTNRLVGAGNFTVEGWIYKTSNNAYQPIIGQSKYGYYYANTWTLYIDGSGTKLAAQVSNNGAPSAQNTFNAIGRTVITNNAWHHVAMTVSGTDLKIFLDGNLEGASTIAGSFSDTGVETTIGTDSINPTSYFAGYIDDIRVTKGVARYLTNFIPTEIPPPPLRVGDLQWGNVSLLLNANGINNSKKVFDLSATPKSIAVFGDTKLSTTQSKFGGSSVLFDGYGDYLSVPYSEDFNFSASDFTIEGWMYETAFSGNSLYGTIISKRNGGGDFDYTLFVNGNNKSLVFAYGTSVSARIDIGSPSNKLVLNQWQHFAVSRKNSIISMFIDGNLVATASETNMLRNRGLPLQIGQSLNYGDSYFSGYLDDIKMTKGVARYSSNFIPSGHEAQPARFIKDPYSNKVSLLLMSNVNAPASDYPRITSTSKEKTTDLKLAALLVNTNVQLDPSTFTPDQVTLRDSTQKKYQASVVKVSPTQYKIVPSSPLLAGNYNIKIASTLLTPTSLPLDQNQNGSGGEEGDIYAENITVESAKPASVSFTNNSQGNGNGTSITLNWNGYTQADNGQPIATFRVYISESPYTSIGQATQVKELPAGTNTALIDGLKNNTTYYVTVVAVDVLGAMQSNVTPTAITVQSTLQQTTSYTYNNAGQILTEDGPRLDVNDVTTYTYNTQGNMTTKTNGLGHVTHYNSYDGMGRLLSVTDPRGVTTEFTYNDRGWLTSSKVKHPTDSAQDALTQYGYDAVGLMTSMALPSGYQLAYEYDGARRLTAVQNPEGERIEYTLDAAGNKTQQTIKNNQGVIVYSLAQAFDELSRIMNATGNHGQQQKQQYDANSNLVASTDGRLNKTQQEFDALNRITKVIDPALKETKYTYDAANRIKTVTDARNNTTTYSYDGFGNLISLASPDTGTTTFSYDAAGNKTSAVNVRGVVTNFHYDAINRLIAITYPASPAENVTYEYDSLTSGNFGIGMLTRISADFSTVDFTYNHQGLITKKLITLGSITQSVEYAYDKSGNLVSIYYPTGRSVIYVRDTAGRVTDIKTKLSSTAPEVNVVTGIRYLPFGPVTSFTYGNGLTHSLTFDNDYRLTNISVGGIMARGYNYDNADNITQINDAISLTRNQSFTYDNLDRLTSATGIYGYQGFEYDAVGNRTGMLWDTGSGINSEAYSYELNSNRLTGINKTLAGNLNKTRSFTYDAAGNPIARTGDDGKTQNFTFNNANRAETVNVDGNLAATYRYNALGQRSIKTYANGTKELYFYDESGQLLAVTNASGTPLREYIYLQNQLVGYVSGESIGAALPPPAAITLINLDESSVSFSGSHVIATNHRGYTGTGFIDYVGEGDAIWSVNIPQQATYKITLMYSLSATANRPIDLLIDGQNLGQYNFTALPTWDDWGFVSLDVPVSAGMHTLVLRTTGKSGPNIDSVQIASNVGAGTAAAAAGSPSGLYFVHNDHHNTPQLVTSASQSVVWAADYEPFGKARLGAFNTLSLDSRFPGQYLDSETGLYYNYFRDYDPSIGRYIESDPIGLNGGINTYAYVEGNPITNIDPLGLQAITRLWPRLFPWVYPKPQNPNDRPYDPENPEMSPLPGPNNYKPYKPAEPLGPTPIPAPMCRTDFNDAADDDNCEALYQSTLRSCASLTGRKKFACYEAARINREQCYQERGAR